jgi:ketosteroid isomerase-like protein
MFTWTSARQPVRMFHFVISLGLALPLAPAFVQAQTPPAQAPSAQVPPAQAPQAPATELTLLEADRDFNKATQEKGLEGWMQFMADDVILLRGKPVFGKDAVRSTLKSDWDEPGYSLSWEPKRGEMFKSGRMGNTSGRWTYRGKNEKGEKITLQGDYLTVWQKQADGSWKVIYDGGTPDPAAR